MRTASQDFSGFSGQTAKSSPSLHTRQNGQNGLDRGKCCTTSIESVPQQGA